MAESHARVVEKCREMFARLGLRRRDYDEEVEEEEEKEDDEDEDEDEDEDGEEERLEESALGSSNRDGELIAV
jgi:hypothetical protein